MKKFILFIALVAGSFFYSNAQISVHLNANLGLQPIWAPVGYDHADYYYIPDIESYYSVSRHQYIYQNGGGWRYSSSLPYRYRNFDMYRAHKVVMNEPYPYRHHEQNRNRYASYRGRNDQENIRDSHENKYFENRDHPQHNEWRRDDHHDNGNHGNRGDNDDRGNHGDKGDRGNHGDNGNHGDHGNKHNDR